ncbi:MAG: hypothetical protein AB7T59_17030 [Hyphomonadaceae bacterium]
MPVPQEITLADASRAIVRALIDAPGEAKHYGYDVWIPNVINHYLITVHRLQHFPEQAPHAERLSPTFYDAAADLARRGVLRGGVRRLRGQAEGDGDGYSVTAAGRAWLADPETALLPAHPSEMGALLAHYRDLFGEAFQERAQEAVRCNAAGAWLATCVMTGAAAEAILIAISAEKTGDEEQVLKELRASGGRARLQKNVTAPLTEPERRAMETYLELLKPWRDVSAHGAVANLTGFEAYEALTRLMRLAIFAKDNWAKLTT